MKAKRHFDEFEKGWCKQSQNLGKAARLLASCDNFPSGPSLYIAWPALPAPSGGLGKYKYHISTKGIQLYNYTYT